MATTQHSPGPFVEIRSSIPNRAAAIGPFIDQLMRFIERVAAKFHQATRGASDIELAVREALSNAVTRRNQASLTQRVYVTCRCSIGGEVSITVEDEGRREPRL